MKRNKLTIFTVIIVFVFELLISASASAATVLKIAYAENSQPVKDALHYLGDALTKKTNGEVVVQYFPDSQLGGERELVELTQVGVVDITKVSSGLMESFSPLYGIFSMPYIFDNTEHFYKVMDNAQIMDPVYQSTKALGFVGMGWYDSGSRSFYMKDAPIKSLSDLKGKKIRVMQSETAIKTMKLLGASPIAMGQSEVYTSIQQGIIDGAENNEFALTVARHAEIAKFYTYDMHTRIPDIILVSNTTMQKLTAAQQTALKEAIAESTQLEKKEWSKAIEEATKQAKDQFKVQFFTIDIAPFQAAVKPIYDELKQKPELYKMYQQIRALATTTTK